MTRIYNKSSELDKRRSLRKSQTEVEALLWEKLRARQLDGHKFKRQFGIGSYVVDFFCAEKKLAIELDGAPHFTKEGAAYDKEREAVIGSLDISFIRFTDTEVIKDLNGVVEKIRRKLQETR